MKKLATAFFLLLSLSLSAQTLFYYGNDSVSANEFLNAWHKNNTGVKTEKAFRDYLNLYIASRLKIREAKERGYDTLPQMVADLENLRQQILPSYLTDKESVDKLVDEAFRRSQKDIHLAHIFISLFPNGVSDSIAALKKLSEAQKKLNGNLPFAEVAKQYSDDPSAKTNGGDLDWITVFSLPYELENLAYATPIGKTSLYRSKAGYHIFKNLGERKDPGRIKASQILIAFPPAADDATKAEAKRMADSLYDRVMKGDDFGSLAARFSNDMVSAAANGQMQEFGTGQYEPVFEQAAFSLARDGAVSKPFLTSYGYHIIKRVGRAPLVENKNDEKYMQLLRDKVEQSDRMATTKAALANKIIKNARLKKIPFSEAELWAFSDSIINYQPAKMPLHLNNNSALFQLGDKTVTASDWINYTQTFRYKPDGSGVKPYPQIWDEFVRAMAIEYYQNHLEQFNETFRQQVNEFREGNLFFEIMQRQVWGPAQMDSAALENYYREHRSKYTWKQSADVVIFYANDAATAKTFSDQLKKSPSSWHELVNNFSEKIAADSARFELNQIPNANKVALRPGLLTSPVVNKADNTVSFAYIIHLYNQPAQRSFAEARGLVINDYQSQLEKDWIVELEKKYPVRVNEKIVKSLMVKGQW